MDMEFQFGKMKALEMDSGDGCTTMWVIPLNCALKSGDITLPAKLHLVKSIVFPVVMYGCENGLEEGRALKNWCF